MESDSLSGPSTPQEMFSDGSTREDLRSRREGNSSSRSRRQWFRNRDDDCMGGSGRSVSNLDLYSDGPVWPENVLYDGSDIDRFVAGNIDTSK